jgi:AraC family transcriptional regulator
MVLALQSDLAQGSPTGSLFGETVMQAFAGYVLRRYGVSQWPDRVNRGGLTGPRLRRVCDYVEDNIERTLHVSDIAAVAGLSPYHFGKAFKSTTGRTVCEYVLDRRISRATRLLRKGDLSIADVATLVGLPNQSHFTRLFRSRTSMTPRSWRSADNKPLD